MEGQVLEEKVLYKVMSNIPLGLVVCKEGLHRKIFFVNRAACDMMGCKKEEFIRRLEKGWDEFMNVNMRRVVRDNSESIRDGKPFEVLTKIPGKDGADKWIMNRVVVQLDEGGLCYISMMDVTASMVQRKSWEEESRNLRELAKRDSFTKLLNRGTMEHLIEKTLQKDNGSQEYAYISLDVDNFKRINDVYGHGVGDMLLLELAGLLQETFGSRNNYIGRMGGDEFAVFAKNYKDREEVYEKAYHVLDEIHQKRDCIGLKEAPSVSIGIAFAPDAGNEFQDLYERADKALYHVKNDSKDGLAVYQTI